MLNKVTQMRLMKVIKEMPANELQNHDFQDEKNDRQYCFDMLEFTVNELSIKLSKTRKNSSDIISRLTFMVKNILEVYLNNFEDSKVEMTEKLYNQLNELKKLYDENMTKKSNFELENLEFIDNQMKKLKLSKKIIIINVDKLQSNSSSNEQDNILEDELRQNKSKLKKIKKDLKLAREEIKKLKNILKGKVDASIITIYEEKLKELLKQIDELKAEEEELTHRLDYSDTQNKKLRTQLVNVKHEYQQEREDLNIQISDLKVKSEKYDNIVNEVEYREWLDAEVTKYIVESNYTIAELQKIISKDDTQITYSDMFNSLKRIKTQYTVLQEGMRNFEASYHIGYKNNQTFNIEDIYNSLDLIIISDMHISKNIASNIYNLNLIYEYAVKNNIRTILNLGDLICIEGYSKRISIEQFKMNNELLEKIVEKLPYDSSIVNLLLGGNHDKLLLSNGIDPLNRISLSRSDYINLGYDHRILNLGNSKIGLHHNDRRYDDKFIMNTSTENNQLINSLDRCYQNMGLNNRSVADFDFLGHFHVSKLSIPNRYATIPSLNFDHINNGAWRLKINFKDNVISNIIFIPIIINDKKVLETSSIIYQKTK